MSPSAVFGLSSGLDLSVSVLFAFDLSYIGSTSTSKYWPSTNTLKVLTFELFSGN